MQNGEKAIALQNRGVSLLNEGKLEEAKAVALENVELREKGLGQVGGTDSLWTATAYQLLGQVHILSPPPSPYPCLLVGSFLLVQNWEGEGDSQIQSLPPPHTSCWEA